MRIPPLPALLGLLALLTAPAAHAATGVADPSSPATREGADDETGGSDGGGSEDGGSGGSEDGGSGGSDAGDDGGSSPAPASDDTTSPRRPDKKASDPLLDEGKRKRIIKIVQRKDFLKFRRLEITPSIGLVGNDPFLRRLLFGSNFAFHVNELLSLEWFVAGSPNLGNTDRKALTNQLLNANEVVPDISRIQFIGVFDVGVSPIFGKIELGTVKIINYDLYLLVGAGVVYTADDDTIIEGGDPKYLKQWHFASNFGFGFRIAFNQFFALRLEGRSYIHIEQVSREELNLEMKNNFAVQFGASFFLPPRTKQTASAK